eukprot:m.433604 g.433604  ORF g.433604 m.433604 type:complete len:295 (+) comp17596_c0_seq1:301-1185(+)
METARGGPVVVDVSLLRPRLEGAKGLKVEVLHASEPNHDNTLVGIPAEPSASHCHLLRGQCLYYHYGVDGTRDHGWGCGYRTLQTIVSWIRLNIESCQDQTTPTLIEIQQVLATANRAKRGHPGFVGSTEWISTEDCYIYLAAVLGVQCRVLTLARDDCRESGLELAEQLAEHFDRGDGPVMIGGVTDNRSRACVGVQFGATPKDYHLLVLDPHFGGRLDSDGEHNELTPSGLATLSQHYRWESMDFFERGSWYNLCCPIPSLGIAAKQSESIVEIGASDSFAIVVESAGFAGE